MLLPLEPAARVRALVRHHVDPVPLPLIQLIEAFITPSVCVILYAKAIYFLISPLASEFAPISPAVGAKALDHTVPVVTRVALVVRPCLYTVAISLSIGEIAVKRATIWPAFGSNALLDPLFKLPLVLEIVHMARQAFTVLKVVGPLALIHLPLDLRELALAMGPAKIPTALIGGPVPEVHHALAMAKAAKPLALVRRPRRPIPVRLLHQIRVKFRFIRIE